MSLVEELSNRVGEEVGVSDWQQISQDQIDMFADATNDHQWIHVDVERAKAGPFGTTIAHGFLTLSLISGLAPQLSAEGAQMVINYGLDRVRFVSPVPVGSRIRARTIVRAVTEVAGGVQVKNEITVELEGSPKPACVAESLIRYYE